MYKVVLSTDSTPIEIREKTYVQKSIPLAQGLSMESIEDHPDFIILRIDGKDYEVDQYEFNRAVRPFLYADEQIR